MHTYVQMSSKPSRRIALTPLSGFVKSKAIKLKLFDSGLPVYSHSGCGSMYSSAALDDAYA